MATVSLITPEGTETMARMFREGIEMAEAKIARIETLLTSVETDTGNEGDYYHMLGGVRGIDDFNEGMWLVIDQERKRIESLNEGLAECELCIEGNTLLAMLRAERDHHYVVKNDPIGGDFYHRVIELIGTLDKKAKGQ